MTVRIDSFNWRGDIANHIARQAGMQGLRDGGEHILTKSQEEIPHDTGTLQRSGAITEDRTRDKVYISYNTPYAVRQHEDLTLQHADGRKAKYLEDPYNQEKDRIMEMVADRIRAALTAGR